MRLLLILFLLFTWIPSFSKINISTISEKVHQQVANQSPSAPENKPAENPSKQTQLDALKKLQNPFLWKRISYNEFIYLNELTKKNIEENNAFLLDYTRLFSSLLEKKNIKLNNDIKQGVGEVNYRKLLKGQRLIYIAEGNNHDTKSAPLEVTKILKSLRKENPNAKILLAAEFLNWEFFYTESIQEYDQEYEKRLLNELNESIQFFAKDVATQLENEDFRKKFEEDIAKEKQEIAKLKQKKISDFSKISLLKKAGSNSELMTRGYENVFKVADRLNIDQLALDDLIGEVSDGLIGDFGEDYVIVKIGDTLVKIDEPEKIPVIYSEQDIPNATERNFYNLEQTLSVSPWGMLQRNQEWARRIQAVLPFYDIVVVYAGNGHLTNEGSGHGFDVQSLVAKENYVDITLFPLEELPKDLQCFYDNRSECVENACITNYKTAFEQNTKIKEVASTVYCEVGNCEWQEGKIYWLVSDSSKTVDQASNIFSEEDIESLANLLEKGPKSTYSSLDINIWLP